MRSLSIQTGSKDDTMIGTLVVTLPSAHTGGALVIGHGGEATTYRGSKFALSMVAFYADCPAGTSSEDISLTIGDAEVCATTGSADLPPYASEYEGYMGNYGNTMDRWYRRAALVVWPRDPGLHEPGRGLAGLGPGRPRRLCPRRRPGDTVFGTYRRSLPRTGGIKSQQCWRDCSASIQAGSLGFD
jgi:hypothetical protein